MLIPGTGCHEGEVPAGPLACRTGRYVVGHWDDFSALQQQLLEGKELICKMEAALQTSVEINLHEVSQKAGYLKGDEIV